jgi:metallo-beta-lactamase family protein
LWYIERFIQEKQIPRIPIYLDSPMGVEVSRAHDLFHDQFDEETLKAFGEKALFCGPGMLCATSRDESKRINADPGPCVIIASSPSCEFGRILHHLRYSVEKPNDVIVFCGWTAPGTLGRRLQDGEKRARIYDQFYDVKCQVRTIHGLSAHADGEELIRFLRGTIRGETQFYIVHGEVQQAELFAQRLIKEGAGRVEIPAMESSVISL